MVNNHRGNGPLDSHDRWEVREVIEGGFVPTIEYFNAFETYREEIQRIFDFENLEARLLVSKVHMSPGLIRIHDVSLGEVRF